MYSPDGRKEWYLEECRKSIYEEPTVELLIRIFNSSELEEQHYGKDISEFSDDQAIDYLKSLNSKSRIRLKNTSWYLSKYHEWCYNKGVIQNIINPFDERGISKIVESIVPIDIINNMFFNKEDLKEYVINEPDCINKIILLCPFYGIKGDEYCEMVNLKLEDLNEKEKSLKLITGRTVYVDDFFIESFKLASKAKVYLTKTESNSRNPMVRIYMQNNYIIRVCTKDGQKNTGNPVKNKFITQRMSLIKEEAGNEFLTISNLYKNGLINYIKQQYALRNISFKTAIIDNRTIYDAETQKYINEFGSKFTVRMLRMQIKDFIDKY